MNISASFVSAANGTPVWTNSFLGAASTVAIDEKGNVFVTGTSTGSRGNVDYTTLAYTPDGVPLWTNFFNGPANGNDVPTGIAVDTSGNVFVTGYVTDESGAKDYATVGYAGNGVPLWTNIYHGPWRDDFARAVAVDADGNVFVTGESEAYPTATEFTRIDFLTIAYSGAGVPLWTNRYGGTGHGGHDDVRGMAVRSGSVFVVGTTWNGTNDDFAIVAYSGAGVPIWTNLFDSGWDDFAHGVAVDAVGNVFVTGTILRPGVLFGSGDVVTVAYSVAGILLWTNRYDGPLQNDDYGSCIAVDARGNVYVSGTSVGKGRDFVTLAYSGLGLPLWTNRYAGPGEGPMEDTLYAMAVDADGNVFVTGYSIDERSSYNYATVAYSASGVPIWTNSFTGLGGASGDHEARAIALDRGGNVYVTGRSRESGAPFNFVTIKYSALLTISQGIAEGSQFRFRFNASSNVNYSVEFNEFSGSSNWVTLTNFLAQPVSTNIEVFDTITSSGRFYRIKSPE